MSHEDRDELAYLWTKVKFVQKYVRASECTFEVAEGNFIILSMG